MGPDCPPVVFIEPLLGVIREQENDRLDTREQGTMAKISQGSNYPENNQGDRSRFLTSALVL